MNLTETITIIEIIAATYPNAKGFNDPQSCAKTAKVWAMLLEDLYPYLVTQAVKKHCMTARFAPTVAEIRESAANITNPALEETAAEAWGNVAKAIRRFGWYREEDALASLNEKTRATVKSIGWKSICESEEPEIIRAQFRKAFETMAARAKDQAMIPETFKKTLKELGGDVFKMIE